MKNLHQRINKLEGATIGRERFIVACGPDGFDAEAEVARRGLKLTSADLLVAVNGSPDREPVTVQMKVDGVMVDVNDLP